MSVFTATASTPTPCRNTGRLALAAELPASVLADLTGISMGAAERWSQWAKRDWASYVGQRASDDAEDIDTETLNKRSKHANRH